MNKVISGVARDVARLGPVTYLAGQAAASQRVQLSVRSWAGALYVFAVNSGWSAANAKMTIPALNGRPLSVMGEGRRVNSDGDIFHRSFRADGRAHLHRRTRWVVTDESFTFTRFREFGERMGMESLISPMEHEHKWDLVDAVSRSPLLAPASIRRESTSPTWSAGCSPRRISRPRTASG